ncbi:MAG: hypothetical protein ACRD4A_13770 [Candidatus Acidiferrales bacterium]
MRVVLKTFVVGIASALYASATLAQGCALCYSDAAATGPTAQAALRHGILILVIPATSIVVGFFSLLCIRRNVHRESVDLVPATFRAPSNSVSDIVLHLN